MREGGARGQVHGDAGDASGQGYDDADDACYVLFDSSTAAFALFEELKRRGVGARISPTPRTARACCGTSLLVDCGDCERIGDVAAELGVAIESTVRLPCQIDPTRDHFC